MTTELKQPAAGNLPTELSSFVGRGRELAEVGRLLSSAHAITLTGPGGIGKSRLALRAGRKLARHFPDGVWWVELASSTTQICCRTRLRVRCECRSEWAARLT